MHSSYETTAVVFLDILGTKNRTSFTEKYAVHTLFHEEVQQNAARQAGSPHVIYKRELRAFSDCVYIFYKYKDAIEESRKNDLNLLFVCLYNTSISILRMLNAGFLVRGGATLGQCFIDDLGFFGPTVEEAYYIESKQALFPRVMLSDKIGSELFAWEQSRETGEIIDAMFTSVPRLILQDTDGRFFLNVFFELERSGVVQFDNLELDLQTFKTQLSKKLISEEGKDFQDANIKRGLAWMKTYVDKSHVRLNPDVVTGARTIVLGQYKH